MTKDDAVNVLLIWNRAEKKWTQYVRELATCTEMVSRDYTSARDLWLQYEAALLESKENNDDNAYVIATHLINCAEGIEQTERATELNIRITRQIKKLQSDREKGVAPETKVIHYCH
jgi:DNA-directed RNA polymerase specialized sigma subunit